MIGVRRAALFAAPALFAIAGLAVHEGQRMLREETAHWVVAPARVLSRSEYIELRQDAGGAQKRRRARLVVVYSANGAERESSVILDAASVQATAQPDATVSLRFNPANPTDVTLEPSPRSRGVARLALGVLSGLLGILALRRARPRRVTTSAGI